MTLEEEKELFKKSSDFAVNYYDHTEVVSLNQVDIVLNQIYNDHEAQIKAKDSITQDIKEAYEFKSIAYDLLLEAIKARDEEIERLKADCELNGLRMFRQGVNSQKKADIGWLKARSIVAMLFWRAKKDKRLADEENKYFTYDMALHSFILFKQAYKMLKDKK